MTRMLSRSAGGRDNNFNLLRFLAAALVLVSHAWPLSGATNEPLARLSGFSMGHLAVDIFFAVSGFLVTGSLLGRRRLGDFLRARALRIVPALAASTLLTAFVIGALQTNLPTLVYLRHADTWQYALRDAICWPWKIAYRLPGVFANVPMRGVVNGSLWSLPYELDMYAALALAGLLAFTGPRLLGERVLRALVIAMTVLIWVGYTANEQFEFALGFRALHALRLSVIFGTGATFYVLRERMPLAGGLFAASLAALGLALWRGHAWMALYPPALEYAVLWLAVVPAGFLRRWNRLGDYSYGFYLWAFPVQQCVMAWRPGTSRVALTVLAAVPTLALSVLSWHFLESPMLALKDAGRKPSAPPPSAPAAPAGAA